MGSFQASCSFGDFAYKSPFDTFAGDGHPLSLLVINLRVTIDGKNILQSVLNILIMKISLNKSKVANN